MNAPVGKPSRPKARLIKKADRSKAATKRLSQAMDRASRDIARSGKREELLKDLPPALRD